MNDCIGFFDSGVGGISVLHTARQLLPNENFLYYGDNGNAPYGPKPLEEIRRLSKNSIRLLLDHGVKAIVIACNTATSAYAEIVRSQLSMPIIGMEPAIKPAQLARKGGDVLVLATKATLSLPKFHRLMDQYGESVIPIVGEGLVELVESGVITNKAKTLHRGQSIATFLMGTRRLYDYVDNNPAVAMYPVDYVNDPYVIGKNDNLVSINSCVQVDIMGQVVSTSAGLRQISGVGGQIDFVRGANISKGGRAIMAMPSTTGKGKISKIVPFLDQGSAVTTSRNDVNYVITEYGIAQLRGKSLRKRAEALIEIAHPDFRDELRAEFRRRYPRDY